MREVSQSEPTAKEREQDLKKVTSLSAYDDDGAENPETQKDEVPQFLGSRSEESSLAEVTSSRVYAPFKMVTSSHSVPSYDLATGDSRKDEHPQILSNNLKESTIVNGSSSDSIKPLKRYHRLTSFRVRAKMKIPSEG